MLYLFSAIASASPETADLLWRALKATYLWDGTGGTTFAVQPETGAVVAHRRLALTGLSYPEFHGAVRHFVEPTAAWGAAGEQAPEGPGQGEEHAQGGGAADLTRISNRP